jgi:hypothetical protein
MTTRNYKKEYQQFHAKPEQKRNRAQRNAARSKMESAGKVRKGRSSRPRHEQQS